MSASLISQVDTERLYGHVLRLEGERHPIRSPRQLDAAADAILAELKSHGVDVRVHEFQVPGFPATFRNIEGWIGDPAAPAAVLMNHYDTFYGTTGANDNAAAVAVMLEAARILATLPDPPAVRFLSFTLEEGNPAHQSRIWVDAQARGLMDGQGRYTSYETSRLLAEHRNRSATRYRNGMSMAGVLAQVTDEMQDELPPAILAHLRLQEEVYAGVEFLPGSFGHLGSWAWMDDAVASKKPLLFGICLDECGRTNPQEGSQDLFPGMSWDMLDLYGVDTDRRVGDFAMLMSNGNSDHIVRAFCEHCRRDDIGLKYAHWHAAMNYAELRRHVPQAFGSDYSAFWREEIPAMFTFDTAGMRKPNYGHTMADTIERLDFDFIRRVTLACVATLTDPSLR
jgi:hypothetical protein